MNAASDGREALNLIEDASKINPENPDIIFGLGIYNYFAEFVPEKYPMLKPLMIIFPKGDRVKGLLQINQAIQNSHYARIEAENILGYINLRYEKKILMLPRSNSETFIINFQTIQSSKVIWGGR